MAIKFDIKKMARAKGRRKAGVYKPKVAPPLFRKQLFNIYNRIVREWSRVIVQELLPAYAGALKQLGWRDGADDILKSIIAATKSGNSVLVAALEDDLQRWAVSVEAWEREDIIRGLRASVGVDIRPFLNPEDAADEISAYISQNVALLEDLSAETAMRVERTVWDAFIKQTPRSELASDLMDEMDIERNRAEFIARDQTTKLGNDMNRIRQEQAGIEQYIWRHSGKVNFREEHKERDGEIFSWDDPPEGGHPGEEPNCGCTAEAYIDLGEDE